VLLVGEKGLGPWQTLEYCEAHDKHVKSPEFPVVLMLLDGHPAPGLPFLRQLHWIVRIQRPRRTWPFLQTCARFGFGHDPDLHPATR
jgi:hypothetical protein